MLHLQNCFQQWGEPAKWRISRSFVRNASYHNTQATSKCLRRKSVKHLVCVDERLERSWEERQRALLKVKEMVKDGFSYCWSKDCTKSKALFK